MMKGAVARRYAQALYEIAVANNTLETMEEEIKGVAQVVEGSTELQRVLYHPQVLPEQKKELLKALFADKVSRESMNFLNLVVDKRRERYITGIAEEFVALANAARNTATAKVTSAMELDEAAQKDMLKVLAKISGREVNSTFQVDPSLIGGVVVQIGDKVIDGSIKTRLATLKSRLMSKTS